MKELYTTDPNLIEFEIRTRSIGLDSEIYYKVEKDKIDISVKTLDNVTKVNGICKLDGKKLQIFSNNRTAEMKKEE